MYGTRFVAKKLLNMGRKRRTTSFLAVGLLIGAIAVGTTATPYASAASKPIYTVMNTSETLPDGVWFRYEPHTADTTRVTGLGVYKNEQVQLQCYAWGDAVGPYHDRLWYWVLNVTRPTNDGVTNQGYLNAHYINDSKPANQVDAGVPSCASLSSGISVYYSPYSNTNGRPPYKPVSDAEINASFWEIGNCDPSAAADMPDGVSTLAGWSLGRLGPIYFLNSATDEQIQQVHTIILFDPGNTKDFGTFGSCDYLYDINGLLAAWLRLNSANHLYVFTGSISDANNYAGLRKYYFAGILGQPFANRALVCDYHGMSHAKVIDYFYTYVQHTTGSCPASPSSQYKRSAWHP